MNGIRIYNNRIINCIRNGVKRRKFSTEKDNKGEKISIYNIRDEIIKKMSVGAQMRNGILMAGTCAITFGAMWYIFREKFRSKVVDETSEITKRSLEHDKVQNQVNQIAKETTKWIIQDDEIYNKLITLIKNISRDEQIKADTSELLKQAIMTESFRATLIFLLKELLQNPETQVTVNKVAKEIVRDLLKDEKLKEELIKYLQLVLADEKLQKSASNASWNSFKMTILPWKW